MKLVRWLALAAVPGGIVFALALVGVHVPEGFALFLGLAAFCSAVVIVPTGLFVWLADKIWPSPQTARLRMLVGAACAISAVLLWSAGSATFDRSLDYVGAFFGYLPLPLAEAVFLRRCAGRVPGQG